MTLTRALDEYQIGWICALPIEAAAASEMLDEKFGPLEEQDSGDTNTYTLGRIGTHYIAIACLSGQYGMTSATTVANNMMRTFSQSLRIGLMVGIGGGIPSGTNDIRLGDIVISYPTDTCGGVLQYDSGKVSEGGKLRRTGFLNSPPRLLLAAVNRMQEAAILEDPLYLSYIQKAVQRNHRTRRNFSRPSPQSDRLFQVQYEHASNALNCGSCPAEWEVKRDERDDDGPQPFYGIIASGNAVIKHGKTREQIQGETEALCFETEAAGLMQDFPCIVIRGICDYADSHKNKLWQGYAALVAAAYAKELLGYVPRAQISQGNLAARICEMITEEIHDLKKDIDAVSQKIDLGSLRISNNALFDSFDNKHTDCLPGTRTKLIHAITDWANSPHGQGIFWLKGKAGTGKSTISRTIARSFRNESSLGASFFFKRDDKDQGTAKHLFSTLARQLVIRVPQLGPNIQRAIKDDPYISEKALGEQFDKLLLRPLQNLYLAETITLLIVIDALDECGSDEDNLDVKVILRLLPHVQAAKCIRLRFLLTSRPELPIKLGFDGIIDHYQYLDLDEIPTPEISHDITLFLDQELSRIGRENKLPSSWPSEEDFQILVEKAVPLFISAATLCRFIGDINWSPQKRLQLLLADQSAYVSKLASTYSPVLRQLLHGQSNAETNQLIAEFKEIVGAIILLATPLSVNTLAELLDTEPNYIQKRLSRLHSVLYIPDNLDIEVRLLHVSFRDYLLDIETKNAKNNEEFWIDESVTHRALTDRCLRLMHAKLQKNICNLPHDSTPKENLDINSLYGYIPSELRYACRYWAHHLIRCQNCIIWSDVLSFLKVHFLHWLEAMSFLGELSEVVEVIEDLLSTTQDRAESEISEFLHDARRFVLKNRQIADTAPLQVYASGLIFAPRDSIIREIFGEEPSNTCGLPDVAESWGPEIQILEGHSREVRCVVFSPDGQLLASGSDDKQIRLWDPTTGQLRQTLNCSGWVDCLAFSPDGQLLASGSDDKQIRLWDTTTGELRQNLNNYSHRVYSVAFSPNGQQLASSCLDTIKIWNLNTGELHKTLKGHSAWISSLCYLYNGSVLASGSSDRKIKLWDTITGDLCQTLEGHPLAIDCIASAPKKQLLASASDNSIKLWDLITGKVCRTLEGHSFRIYSISFSPDGKILASGSVDKKIKLWDPITGNLRQTLEDHSWISSVSFSPNGELLASGSGDNIVKLWDPTAENLQQTHGYHYGRVNLVVFSPNGQLLASCSQDSTIKLWNPITGELCQNLEGHSASVSSIIWSPNSQILVSSSNDQKIKVWYPTTGKLHLTLDAYGSWCVAISSNGQILASGSEDKIIRLWNLTTGGLYHTLKGHSYLVHCIAFSPDKPLLASGSDDSTIKLWDLSTGKLHRTLEGHSSSVISINFSPNGQMLISASEANNIRVWNPTTGDLLHVLKDCFIPVFPFSPDEQILASGSGSVGHHKVKLWNITTGELLQTLEGHYGWIWLDNTTGLSMLDEQWICLQSKKLLWLPPDYRPLSSAFKNGILAQGHASGRVSFFSLSRLVSFAI